MESKDKHSTRQLFNFVQDSYLERTSRPIYALVFLLPFIVFYEIGVIFSNTDLLNESPVLVDTFVWLQKFLESLGFSGKSTWLAPPLIVVLILIALQLTSRRKWRFWFADIWRMAVECVLLAIPLVVLVLFINSLGKTRGDVESFDGASTGIHNTVMTSCSAVSDDNLSNNQAGGSDEGRWKCWLANITTGIGAGIYEELVFRLILICVLMMMFQDVLRLEYKTSILLAILISAALFSAHHHIDFLSGRLNPKEPFNLVVFGFRTVAGIYFAVLFAIRGFGITAGTHAFYNIIAVSINARFFQQ